MGIRERCGNWHYRIKVAGHEYSGDCGLAATERNRTKAQRMEAEARRLVLAGRETELRIQPKQFSEAVKQYLSWCDGEYREHPNSAKRIRGSFTSLKAHFGTSAVSAVTTGSIEDYKGWRRTSGVKEITLRHDLHALSGFLQYCMKHGWVAQNLVEKVEIPSDKDAVRIHVLTAEEERVYFAACLRRWGAGKSLHGPFTDLHDMARLVLEQGMRPDDEVLSLPWSAIDWSAGRVTVERGKSAAARRTLRLTPTSRAILEARWMSKAGAERWVFPSRVPGKHVIKLNAGHEEVLQHTGLRFVPYDLRHTFATRMANAGCPLPTLQRILGHASLRTIQRYVHPSQGDMDEAMEKYSRPLSVPLTALERANINNLQ